MVNSQVPGGGAPPRSCAGCGGRIADRFLLFSMERYWHTRCLKCSCCQAQLGEIGTSCYTKSGMILCRNDYIRCVYVCLCVCVTGVISLWLIQFYYDRLDPCATTRVE